MTDRRTKVLLGLIATALWAIALRPMLPALDATAQTQAPASAPKKVNARYEFLENDQGGTVGIYALKDKLDAMASKGWRVNNIAITGDATVIVMEKTE